MGYSCIFFVVEKGKVGILATEKILCFYGRSQPNLCTYTGISRGLRA